ncbi:hypothetical protein Vwe01_33560 [Micromonospora andamanensis]|nr:hypothetical protein Vwe01_33560 [Micromonospora andamanensis]
MGVIGERGGRRGGYHGWAMIRLSPGSFRKNGRVTGSVEPDGAARHSRTTSGRLILTVKRGGTAGPGTPVTAYR